MGERFETTYEDLKLFGGEVGVSEEFFVLRLPTRI